MKKIGEISVSPIFFRLKRVLIYYFEKIPKKITRFFIKFCTFRIFYVTINRKCIFECTDERSNVIFVEAGRVFFIER